MEKLDYEQNKQFYRKLIKLGAPFALQQFITAFINMLDTFMLGGVSEDVLTAAGLANKLFFVFIIMTYGVSSGAGIFIAQFFGKGDKQALRKYLGIALTAAMVVSSTFMLIALVVPHIVMNIFSSSPAVVAHGIRYLRITGLAYIPTALATCLYGGLKSTRHAYIPLIFTFVALVSNAVFNYIFIYVLNMGIDGAAYATLISRLIEFTGLVSTVSVFPTAIKAPLKEYFSFSKTEVKNYFRFAGFVIFVEFEWALGNALYSLAFRRYGTTAQAAVQVTDSCVMLLNVFAIALGAAAAVILGNTIGEGESDTAVLYARKLWLLSILVGAGIGALLAVLSPFLPLLFTKLTDEGRRNTTLCLLTMAAALPVRCLEFMLVVGILRSGGDTKFSIVCDIIGVWLMTLPMLLLAAYLLKLPFIAVYALINIEMVFKIIIGSHRFFKSRKWLHDVTVRN